MQMIVHQVLSLATITYMLVDLYMFDSKIQTYVEIGTEVLLLLASIMM